MRAGRLTTSVVAIGLVLGACGGDDDVAETTSADSTPDSGDDSTTVTTSNTTTITTTITDATAPAADSTTPTSTAPTTTTPTTTSTTEPTAEPIDFDLATLPTLIADLESAVATGDPFDLAVQLGGFPFPIPVPDGSTTARIDVDVDADADVVDHEFSYSAVAPGGTVPDVDITLDDNGPGSVQIVEIWDPILADLGFERANSTASDPGDPGGPNSVNHVYVPADTAPETVNGVPATVGNVFVWADEDVTGAASGLDPTEPAGGYRIDVDAELDAAGPIGVPLLAAIAELVPLPDGTTLDRATLRLETRPSGAYEIDRGVNYVSIAFEWTAAPGATVDEVVAFYADPASFTGDDLLAAEPSFFDEGTYEPTEIAAYGDTDHRLPVLLLGRYGGTLWVEAPSDPAEPVTISYDVTLNPTDVALTPPAD